MIGDTKFMGRKIIEEDPIDTALKPVFKPEPLFTNDPLSYDQENFDKGHEYENRLIGRYAHGFRHYENYANYS